MGNFPAAALRVLLVFSSLILVVVPFAARAKAGRPASDPARKPVVVELFTSEGCSSCPPADALLRMLQEQQPVAQAEIIAIEEHVDYWNHDGWIDPYSSSEWTQRQQTYAALVKKDTYTPELVVDGRSQFVGSDAHQAGLEIEKAARSEKTEVAITAEKPDASGAQRFTVSVGKLAGNKARDVAEVWLAVTEDGLQSSVSRGENAGHVLQHAATLRSLRKIGVAQENAASGSFSGDQLVKFNSHWNPDHLHVMVFVQEKKSREILGAASVKTKG
jgi:hypothetical protein